MAQLFGLLRPFCVALAQNPSLENASRLKKELQALGESDLPHELFEYILFPLNLVLQTSSCSANESLLLTALDCIGLILRKASLKKEAVVSELMTQFAAKATGLRLAKRDNVDKPKISVETSDVSEEIKMSCVSCLRTLLECSTPSVRQSLYTSEKAPLLGHAVSVTLQVVASDTARSLQLEAMRCLLALCWCSLDDLCERPIDKEPISQDVRLRCQTVASFLPGIATAVSKVILGDSKQGQAVLSMAFRTWSAIVATAMNDRLMPQDISLDMNDSEGEEKHGVVISQNRRWWKETASKLQELLKRILSTGIHSQWKLHLSVCQFARMLLQNCNRSLENCVPQLVDVLVAHLNDDYKAVSKFSRQALDCFSVTLVAQGSGSLISMFEENIHSLVTRLPRVIRMADDSQKVPALDLLIGYLRLLGPRISSLLSSSAHLKRLAKALLQILELELSDIRIMEEHGAVAASGSGASMLHQPVTEQTFSCSSYKLQFQHFNNDCLKTAILEAIRLLGCYGDLSVLVDYFIDYFTQSSLWQKQSVLIINELLRGSAHIGLDCGEDEVLQCRVNSQEAIEGHIRSLLPEYVSDSLWHVVTTIDTRIEDLRANQSSYSVAAFNAASPSGLTVQTLNSNTILICLLLDGIAAFAEVLGTQFDGLLMTALYPVLEKMGDSKGVIRNTALHTLTVMCQCCGYNSISNLICHNADYLIDVVSLNLRHLDMNPTTPRVLKVMLEHSDEVLLPLVDDTLREVFAALDGHFDDTAILLVPVLQSLIEAVCRWFPSTTRVMKTEKDEQERIQECWKIKSCSILEYLTEYCHKKKEMEEINTDVEDDEIIGEQDATTDETEYRKEPIPGHRALTVEVLDRCIHFVSSKNARLRLLVLSVIQNGLFVLRSATDQLLPQVHKLWAPLAKRFADVEPVVMIKALDVLSTMSEVSGDFIRKRVVTDVWPLLSAALERMVETSLHAGRSYRHTVNFKLQKAILTALNVLIAELDMGDVELCEISTAVLPYLNVKQPKELQEAASQLFRALAAADVDATWLIVNEAIGCSLSPPHPCFNPVKLGMRKRPKGIQYSDALLDMIH